jgi:hypothetical protein
MCYFKGARVSEIFNNLVIVEGRRVDLVRE